MHAMNYQRINQILDDHGRNPLRLVQILIGIQAECGGIPASVRDYISKALAVPLAQVHGVVAFYHFLSPEIQGQYRIYVADNIIDRMHGNQEVMATLLQELQAERGKPRADGQVFIDYTSCTGLCDQGPALLINSRALTHVTPDRAKEIAERINAGEPLNNWPSHWFQVEESPRVAGPVLASQFEPGRGLQAALEMGPAQYLKEVERAGLRGRGGAGFRTAIKWRVSRDAPGKTHYVICNADEGEPGTFKDRALLTRDADAMFEGMTLAGLVIGAEKGFLYLRGEYTYLYSQLVATLARRRAEHLLGKNILGREFNFDVEIHLGAGAYVAGEESALIESLEGKCAVPRPRPPFTATHGYLGQPTVCNNVETFVKTALIAQNGADWFLECGTRYSPGSKLLSVSGDVARPGIYEYPFGTSVQTVLEACGARETQAVQIGGPSGTCITPNEFDRAICYEDLSTGGSFMVFNRSRDMLSVVQNFIHFFADESCGFCTPCRVGTQLMRRAIDKIVAGKAGARELKEIEHAAKCTRAMSHCGLGQTATKPFLDTLDRLRPQYEARLSNLDFVPNFDLDQSLSKTRALSQRDDPHAHLPQTGEACDARI
ncbi:MAG: NAD(P)H-dependent oxidoreductase subunit E [Paludibacterium sp.]|uniref:NAD(P)H-dependent oxidoreductase subunit E n=1 Tax=Paludibacterium sp. TaxID=1917523 RepID=UPI0025D5EE0A|nr:NAD(P)H-dependent oxidoreductase subunit E [Paludibacterium sp.]MBV8046490.1 NAD(P)H-dependent oxidoreductase subunit E [Paludibacterium sp.]MBV8646556.1 NAD(P)H-dependent oxidoreductase subunit E [Paludibacterium sp.]